MKNKTDIIWLDSAESSNDEARMAIEDLDNLSVIAVRHQTKGRGQGDHQWCTAPGMNLTFSIILKDIHIPAAVLPEISLETARSVVDLLARYGISARIKLPNDVYVGENKICGILIENSLKAGLLNWSIIGVGINVYQNRWPEWIPNPTSMKLESDIKEIPLELLLKEFLSIFISRINVLISPLSAE